ncbi:pre-mRNA 3'-end-processing factor FIP1 isoform X2 [Kryptolebias marmoratus]|uniref:pre-mRNA 3'-end-processing factor FIP1 isoform X2 n=1 Tax=Kryptolebias marmoratus TaxID=37003 RepID=UPI0018ACE5D7|nr:pre-mRNA 3'-end-processing factor FIP1 isoform X2 [Kryptolebias marmoratus]
MSTPDSDFMEAAEDEDEDKLYQWIFELSRGEREEAGNEQSPCSSRDTRTPLEIIFEEKIDTAGSSQEVVKNIKKVKRPKQKEELFKEKPWTKPGAELSDYFNYGFDEESWRAYCKKQTELQAFQRSQGSKILAKKEHAQHREKVSRAFHSSGRRAIKACSRESEDDTDLKGGQAGRHNRNKRRPSLSDAANNSQVLTEMPYKVDDISPCDSPPPASLKSLLDFVSPPSSLVRSGCSPSPTATQCSGLPEGFDGPSTSGYQSSSGSKAASPVMTDTTKAWECYIKQRKHGRDRVETRGYNHHKRSRRSRYKGRQSSSSSHNSREEQRKNRVSTEHGCKCRSPERFCGQKRPRDKSEGWHQKTQSCNRKKDGSEDKHRRRKCDKKAKK